jgi:hypothetical protein
LYPLECGYVYLAHTDYSALTITTSNLAWTPIQVGDDRTKIQRLNHYHHIQIHDLNILSTKPAFKDWLIKEVLGAEVHTSNISWEDGLILGQVRETTHSLPQGV